MPTLIDLDRPTQTRHTRRHRAIAAMAVVALLLAGTTAAAPTDHGTPVTVTATGVTNAAAAIWTTSGHQLTPAFGEPALVTDGPASVTVIGWATTDTAHCAIHVDGRQVAEHHADAVGLPVSCVWPN